jgi:hypothetical protein
MRIYCSHILIKLKKCGKVNLSKLSGKHICRQFYHPEIQQIYHTVICVLRVVLKQTATPS